MKNKLPLLALFVVLIVIAYVTALPEAPTGATYQSSSNHNTSGVYNTSQFGAFAEAGNITYINLTAEMSTKTWAAYYGNVSGTMLLENVNGNKMYDWSLTNPSGKIFATQTIVSDWNSVYCWNWSKPTGNGLHWSEWNLNFSVSANDADAVNATFDATYDYTPFYLTGRLFDQNGGTEDNDGTTCPGLELYNNSGAASGDNQYEEIILGILDPSSSADTMTYDELIYMATIEPSGLGFDGSQIDFQMIVPVDGHDTAQYSKEDYYFYIELEAS